MKERLLKLKLVWLTLFLNAKRMSYFYSILPGKYKREWIDEEFKYCQEFRIERLSGMGGLYTVSCTDLQFSLSTTAVEALAKQEFQFVAVFSHSSNCLFELGSDCRTIAFYPEKDIVYLDNVEFERVPQKAN